MMRKQLIYFAFILCAVLLASCSKNDDPVPPPVSGDPLETYWNDNYTGKYGIQVGILPDTGAAGMMLAGLPLYVTGINCYDLFTQSDGGMGKNIIRSTVLEMQTQQVPVVRFTCSPYRAYEIKEYLKNKEDFLGRLKYLARLCDECHILLIPSIFWNTGSFPEYCEEKMTAWGDVNSKTYALMLSYAGDIINTLKGHKCIAAWEFGNEFNLSADIGIAGYEQMPATCVQTALKGFGELASSLDNSGRMICSGHSVMRPAQWHLYHQKNWTVDSFAQYVEMTDMMTPSPVNGMSEHVYDEPRVFSDKGTCTLAEQLEYAKQCAASIGKAYYVGEFTGTACGDLDLVREHYQAHYDSRIQLSMVWNFTYKSDIEYSFKYGTEAARQAFDLMREYNKKIKDK